MKLDHLVINTRFQTDAAAALFAALGFTLTPRGHHTLGSINHLVMFDHHYLELIGLPNDGGKLRQEVLNSPGGIDGLVMQTQTPEAVAADLDAKGFGMGPVQQFSRPVEVEGQTLDASFVTVRLNPGQVAAGRVYYCHHLTPELVWRAPWLTHDNGVTGIVGLTVVGHDPASLRTQYADLGVELDTRFVTQAAFFEKFGAHFGERFDAFRAHMPVLAPSPELATQLQLAINAPEKTGDDAPRAGYFGAITLKAAAPDAVATRARDAGLPVYVDHDRVVVALPTLATYLEFIR